MTSTGPIIDIHGYIAGGQPMTQPTEQDFEKARKVRKLVEGRTSLRLDLKAQQYLDEEIALALSAERDALREALKPFAEAAAGIPSDTSDSAPAVRVSNDARTPGTVTSINVAAFRRARALLCPEQDAQRENPR